VIDLAHLDELIAHTVRAWADGDHDRAERHAGIVWSWWRRTSTKGEVHRCKAFRSPQAWRIFLHGGPAGDWGAGCLSVSASGAVVRSP
jgi:hypothetical protein